MNSGGPADSPTMPPIFQPGILGEPPLLRPYMPDDDNCLPWIMPDARSTTVSVMKLEVPSKARGDYQKACNEYKRKQFEAAEQHARSAIAKFQDYEAAWVMLGQVLEEQHHAPEAREACARVTAADPRYLPAYLCSADFAAHDQQWQQVLDLANLAAGLNPVGDGYVSYYRGLAYFHLHDLPHALRNAEKAAEIDKDHHEPPIHFLLAQIYIGQGNLVPGANELRQFIRLNKDPDQAEAARQLLAELDSQSTAK